MAYKVIFIGSSDIGIPSLQNLLQDKRFDVKLIVTQPDKKVGRKQEIQFSPVKEIALKEKIEYIQPHNINDEASLEVLQKVDADYMVVISYGAILSQQILDIPKIAAVNVHTSLLPKYRGASPIQTALLNGDDVTGVTIQKMVKKLDAGDILAQQEIVVEDRHTFISLQEDLGKIAAPLLAETLSHDLFPIAQDESQVSFCHKIDRKDGEIDWQNSTAQEIYNRYRAFDPWPGIYTYYSGKRLKLLSVSVDQERGMRNEVRGVSEVIQADETIGVVCKSGVLLLHKVQLEGKKPMEIGDFVRGYQDFVGDKLG